MSFSGHRKINRFLGAEFGISEPEEVHIMLIPHLHLSHLVATGEWDHQHVASVAGVFNVALALAYINKDRRSINFYSGIQELLLALANGQTFGDVEKRRLQMVFSEADKYICGQRKTDILTAIRMVEYQIANAPPETVVRLDGK
ncbi:hypothetical protein GBK02_13985 [Dechloromonas sp. TW-R-39-2]|uniref:hypothetical protein n=1 Tax=Dechloromonas sp. TW-R-39-2 TaxID=2654218 RepID=UPI00193E9C15|nr:hypothetical protein [Dechloromonas sp. TW-R-39-2]QRM20419.1 hypothetical protein GBK02_13985 [Dechloromonas sp. TW-R-39-2]